MRVLGEAILVRGGSSGEIDGIYLCHVGSERSRGCIDLLAIIGGAGAIDVKTSEDLGDRFVDTKHDLDVTCRILTGNGDGILGADCCGLLEDRVSDLRLDLLDLLDRLVFGQAVNKEIDIGRRRDDLVIVLSERPLGTTVLARNRQQSRDNRATGSHHIAPI